MDMVAGLFVLVLVVVFVAIVLVVGRLFWGGAKGTAKAANRTVHSDSEDETSGKSKPGFFG